MDRIKTLWSKYGRWALLGLPVIVIAVCIAASTASSDDAPRTMAEASTETEITFDMEANRAYTASDGVVVIPASKVRVTSAEVTGSLPLTANLAGGTSPPAGPPALRGGLGTETHTQYTLPEDAQMADGSVGLLTIPKLSLAVNVYESDDEMEAMTHGVAHFKTTSAWSGNVGLCSHNVNFNLTDGYFKNIHTLQAGDTVSYQTALGSRTYTVETVAEIAETDWSYLGRTEDNRVTLITCISGKPRSRLVVQAVAM